MIQFKTVSRAGAFDVYNPSLVQAFLNKFFKADDNQGESSALFFFLSRARGSNAIYSKDLAGVTDTRFSLVTEDVAELDRFIETNRDDEYQRAIGMSSEIFDRLYGEFIGVGAFVTPLQFNGFTQQSDVETGVCWICGRPIMRAMGRRLICSRHELEPWNLQGYNVGNNEFKAAKKNALIMHYLKDKLSFGVEFEVGNVDHSVDKEIATVLKHHGWILTRDGSVEAEFKSPIYTGFLPLHEPRGIFQFFDYCIRNRFFQVNSQCGTHLHVATTDGSKPWANVGAIRNQVESNFELKRKLYQFFRGLEIVIDTAEQGWVNEIFGRLFNTYCRKQMSSNDGVRSNLSNVSAERYHWINVCQRSSSGPSRTVEFRLLKYRDAAQYLCGLKVGIWIYKAVVDILWNNANPYLLVERFERKCAVLFNEKHEREEN